MAEVSNDAPRDVREALADLSRISLSGSTLAQALGRIAELAREAVPRTAAASVTLFEHGRVRSLGITGPLAAALDERQYETGFGPCLEAAISGEVVLIADTEHETVYRDFATLALRLGVTSVLSVGLAVDHRVVGALNIYRDDGPVDEPAAALAAEFARYAAVVVDNAAEFAGASALAGHLRIALGSRAVIEQAKGVLMERHRWTADQAFAFLAAQSQRRNRKLRDIAADLVAAVPRAPGTGPGPPGSG